MLCILLVPPHASLFLDPFSGCMFIDIHIYISNFPRERVEIESIRIET